MSKNINGNSMIDWFDVLFCEYLFAFHILQNGHLLDGDLVEFVQAVGLRYAFVDKDRIDILHIRKANQLIDSSIVTHVAFEFGIGIAPFFGSHTKQCHIQHICLFCID